MTSHENDETAAVKGRDNFCGAIIDWLKADVKVDYRRKMLGVVSLKSTRGFDGPNVWLHDYVYGVSCLCGLFHSAANPAWMESSRTNLFPIHC